MTACLFEIASPDEGVACVRIATDDEPYLGVAWVRGFVGALGTVGVDPRVRVVILEGGERTFCSGASREALLDAGSGDDVMGYAAVAVRALFDMPVPVIAAMAGHAIGGGLLLGLWSDTAVLAEDSLYGANFMALGFTPGMGATAVVPEAFGPVLGRRMLFTGELISGRDVRSAACPLSHAVCPRHQVRARARWIARDIADGSRSAIVLLRRMVAERRRVVFEQALTEERNSHASLFADEETRREIEQRYPPSGRPAGAS